MLMLFGLCACAQSAKEATPGETEAPKEAEEAPDVAYRVSVTDTEGNPVPGVTLQFCDENSCTKGDTDADGAAVFTAKEGTYTVHVLEVPDGYLDTEEEFPFPETGNEISITLETPKPAINKTIIGFAYYNPEEYEDLQGSVSWDVSRITMDIYAVTAEYYIPEEYMYVPLFELLCVQKDESEAEAYLKEEVRPRSGWDAFTLEKVGSAENLTCFLAQEEEDPELYKDILGEYYDEFAALREDKETFLSGIRLSKPADEIMLFETQDLDGNAVSMSDILAGHKVTMVNLWATWCGPCVAELPILAAFAAAHPDAAVLAIHAELVTEDVAAWVSASEITLDFALDETGAVTELLGASTMLPHTVILDRTGKVLYNRAGSITAALLEDFYSKAD